jgi:putative flippase GtrA
MRLPEALRRFDAPVVRQFIKYGIVGASNTVITLLIYSVSVEAGVTAAISLAFGYLAGTFNSYLLNHFWTFRGGDRTHATAGRRFATVQTCAFAFNEVALYVLVHHAGFDTADKKVLAQAILTVPVLVVTFFVNRAWSFAASAPAP